jgi:hypothetical protein
MGMFAKAYITNSSSTWFAFLGSDAVLLMVAQKLHIVFGWRSLLFLPAVLDPPTHGRCAHLISNSPWLHRQRSPAFLWI